MTTRPVRKYYLTLNPTMFLLARDVGFDASHDRICPSLNWEISSAVYTPRDVSLLFKRYIHGKL